MLAKLIAAKSECSQSRYSFFEVVHSLYSSNIDIRGLLFISIGKPEEGFGGYFSKPLIKSYRRQVSKSLTMDFIFIFSFHFILFLFLSLFYFLFLE